MQLYSFRQFRLFGLIFCLWPYGVWSTTCQPVPIISAPTVADMAVGQEQSLDYVIHNQLNKAQPIKSILVVNMGDSQPDNVFSVTHTCGNSLHQRMETVP